MSALIDARNASSMSIARANEISEVRALQNAMSTSTAWATESSKMETLRNVTNAASTAHRRSSEILSKSVLNKL